MRCQEQNSVKKNKPGTDNEQSSKDQSEFYDAAKACEKKNIVKTLLSTGVIYCGCKNSENGHSALIKPTTANSCCSVP